MPIFETTDRVEKWKYHVVYINLIIPGEGVVNVPRERLTSMSLVEDYMNNYFPLFKVSLALDSELYYKILEYKNDCRINIRIDKLFIGLDSPEQSLMHPFLNDNFKLILDENTEDLNHSDKVNQASRNYQTMTDSFKDALSSVDNKLSFYLFKSEVIQGTKNIVNNIFKDVNLTDVVTAYMTKVGISNVLMAPLDNITTYKELLVPPLSILKALTYLDNYFGFYKRGSLIYFGIDTTYIIPFSGNCRAFTSREIQNTIIIIPKSTSSHTTELGILNKRYDTNNRYIIGDYRTVSISNDSITNNYINANEVLVIDSYEGTQFDSNSGATNDSKNFKKVYENRSENLFIGITYAAQSASLSNVINVRLADYDLDAIKPNKRFQFIFEESQLINKYKEDYILVKAEHTFELEGEELAVSSVLSFCVDKKVQGE